VPKTSVRPAPNVSVTNRTEEIGQEVDSRERESNEVDSGVLESKTHGQCSSFQNQNPGQNIADRCPPRLSKDEVERFSQQIESYLLETQKLKFTVKGRSILRRVLAGSEPYPRWLDRTAKPFLEKIGLSWLTARTPPS
jgi:hypothetical protein